MNIRKIAALLCVLVLLLCVLVLLLCACGKKEAKLPDGSYTVEVTLTGGTGKAKIQSPAELTVKDGQITATLVWSSKNYDYMIVDEVKYEPVSYEPGSTFVVPLKALADTPIIGDTIAMSTPHEVSYTLSFGEVKSK